MSELLARILKANREIGRGGVVSVCSAHPVVLEACMEQAKEDGSFLLVESTSNQVDQFAAVGGNQFGFRH